MLSLTLTLATVAVAFVGLAERQLHLAQPDLACANNDCSGRGVCRDGACHCDANWQGAYCTQPSCPALCHGRGRCSHGTCLCDPGYSGAACELGGEPTCPDHCSGHGWCVKCPGGAGCPRNRTDVAAVCECAEGWSGVACDIDTCPDHCSGQGRCDHGVCRCHPGWAGAACADAEELPYLFAAALPSPSPQPPQPRRCPDDYSCSGRGDCVYGKCACRAGFAGEACENVVSACPGGCRGHGFCDAPTGKCRCALGYAGADCGRSACADVWDTSAGGCHGNGRCVCDAARQTCACECRAGFAPPRCEKNTCPEQCHGRAHGKCSPLGVCTCEPRWRGPSCAIEICPLGCSVPHGECIDGSCECTPEWTGDACELTTCPGAIATPLGTLPCSGHGKCDGGTCVCEEPWTNANCSLNRHSERAALLCAQRQCGGPRHGRCADHDHGKCVCESGWVGANCTEPLCPTAPGMPAGSCNGNGWCSVAGCSCYQVDGVARWRGKGCEEPVCPNDCSGFGTCNLGQCDCNPGHAGADCSIAMNPKRVGVTLPAALGRPRLLATAMPPARVLPAPPEKTRPPPREAPDVPSVVTPVEFDRREAEGERAALAAAALAQARHRLANGNGGAEESPMSPESERARAAAAAARLRAAPAVLLELNVSVGAGGAVAAEAEAEAAAYVDDATGCELKVRRAALRRAPAAAVEAWLEAAFAPDADAAAAARAPLPLVEKLLIDRRAAADAADEEAAEAEVCAPSTLVSLPVDDVYRHAAFAVGPSDVVIDLGAGVGLPGARAVAVHGAKGAVGIELSATRVAQGCAALRRLAATLAAELPPEVAAEDDDDEGKIELRVGDVRDADVGGASRVLLFATCFPRPMAAALQRRLAEELPDDARVFAVEARGWRDGLAVGGGGDGAAARRLERVRGGDVLEADDVAERVWRVVSG